jgi:hypothetical protein
MMIKLKSLMGVCWRKSIEGSVKKVTFWRWSWWRQVERFVVLTKFRGARGVGIIYFVNANLLLVVSWVWLPQSGFYLEVLKGFPLHKQTLCCGCVCLCFSLCMFSDHWYGLVFTFEYLVVRGQTWSLYLFNWYQCGFAHILTNFLMQIGCPIVEDHPNGDLADECHLVLIWTP